MTQKVDRDQILARCAAGERWHTIAKATHHHWRTVRSVALAAGYAPYGIGMPCRPISDEERLIGHLIALIGISPTARRVERPVASVAALGRRLGVQSPLRRGRPRKNPA